MTVLMNPLIDQYFKAEVLVQDVKDSIKHMKDVWPDTMNGITHDEVIMNEIIHNEVTMDTLNHVMVTMLHTRRLDMLLSKLQAWENYHTKQPSKNIDIEGDLDEIECNYYEAVYKLMQHWIVKP